MNLLAIDTSTDFCSVAASRGETLFARHERAGQRHAERILDMVDQVLVEARLEFAQIQGIAYGAGPGSFTGLRIAAAGRMLFGGPPRGGPACASGAEARDAAFCCG